jgi:hypothetical protein
MLVQLGFVTVSVAVATATAAQKVKEGRTSLCYVSTPEFLQTLRGRFVCIYRGNGYLKLDDQSLSFTSRWQSVTIPLTSIRGLGLGEFSHAAKRVPLHYFGA